MNPETEVVLIDLSSIAYPIWHMSQAEPDPNAASQKIVARIRALASNHAHAAICCDAGRSFRHDLSPAYKANRPEHEAMLHHQIALAKEQLAADGFPVWGVPGFEADDLVATAATQALATEGATVLIVSADKDLLQLVGPRVRAMSVRDGSILDAEAVGVKFGVRPEQMGDYLTLVGDSSDNIRGAKGIGPKKAADLLAKFGSLDALYAQLTTKGGGLMGLPPAVSQALREFQPNLAATRALIALRTDVPLPFEAVWAPRVPQGSDPAASFAVDDEGDEGDDDPAGLNAPGGQVLADFATRMATNAGHDDIAAPAPAPPAVPPTDNAPASAPSAPSPSTGLAVREPETLLPAPVDWERGLDPRSMREARLLAKDMYDSRMFSAYGTPQAVLSTIMVGRELGLPAMASLRSIHVIDGRQSLSAALMAAMVLKSGLAEYFEPVEFSETSATFETHRRGARNPVRLTHTIEMAQKAWSKTQDAWTKSGWGRNPTDMLVARCQARLARLVYPDLLAGLYTPEELEEIRESRAA